MSLAFSQRLQELNSNYFKLQQQLRDLEQKYHFLSEENANLQQIKDRLQKKFGTYLETAEKTKSQQISRLVINSKYLQEIIKQQECEIQTLTQKVFQFEETRKRYESELTTFQHVLQGQQTTFALERESFETIRRTYEKERETFLSEIEHLRCECNALILEKERLRSDFERLSFEAGQWRSEHRTEPIFNDTKEVPNNQFMNPDCKNKNSLSTEYQFKKEETTPYSAVIKKEITERRISENSNTSESIEDIFTFPCSRRYQSKPKVPKLTRSRNQKRPSTQRNNKNKDMNKKKLKPLTDYIALL
jgi:predicted  nucleic acid-binding Zn-ribbon protein